MRGIALDLGRVNAHMTRRWSELGERDDGRLASAVRRPKALEGIIQEWKEVIGSLAPAVHHHMRQIG